MKTTTALSVVFAASAVALLSAQSPSGPRAGVDWPGFRGIAAAGVDDAQPLPLQWSVPDSKLVKWRVPVSGLGHSSPIVWGDRLFVTSAISQQADATFKPGLYGDGDASDDRSRQKWMLYAIDKRTGRTA